MVPELKSGELMEYLVGLIPALAVSAWSILIGFDKDRAFYPTVLIVITSYCGLFAVMGGSVQALLFESIAIGAFFGLPVLGFKRSLWPVVGALLAHGIFDFLHSHIVTNSGVPAWWSMFCLTCDIMAAACLAGLLKRSHVAVYSR